MYTQEIGPVAVRYAFLALLVRGAAHGYELKQAFESSMGEAWPPVNYGQVYTTLARLERDGLIEGEAVDQDDRPNKRVYRITDDGRRDLDEWVQTPSSPPRLRNELLVKLIMAKIAGLGDVQALINSHRHASLQHLRDLDAVARQQSSVANPTSVLLVESAALHLQAELRWLERCEILLVDDTRETDP